MTTVAVLLVCLIGGIVHRLTGMGFALVAVPPLVFAVGPEDGVSLAVFGALIASLLVGLGARRDADRGLANLLVIAVLAGCPLGVLVTLLVPSRPMSVIVAVMTLAGVTLSVLGRARGRAGSIPVARNSTVIYATAGVLSGAMSVTSGIGGPPLSAVASWRGLPHEVFVSTAQVPFVVMGVLTVGVRWLVVGFPGIPWWCWPAMPLVLLAGVYTGAVIATRVRPGTAWYGTLGISAAGAVALLAGSL